MLCGAQEITDQHSEFELHSDKFPVQSKILRHGVKVVCRSMRYSVWGIAGYLQRLCIGVARCENLKHDRNA